MRHRDFRQVDVFTQVAFYGNPVAVVLDAEGLSQTQMQAIARWTNLSETTFVLPPPSESGADYGLRIFTPNEELPFAGHPSVGTAFALLEGGHVEARDGRLVQACGAGLVPLKIERASEEPQKIFVRVPKARIRSIAEPERRALTEALGAASIGEALVVEVGQRWLTVKLNTDSELMALKPDMVKLSDLSQNVGADGVNCFAPRMEAPFGYELRSLAPLHGVDEDPVCGGGNGALAAYLHHLGQLERPTWVVRQGRCIARDGYVEVRIESPETNGDPDIWVGGHCVGVIDGQIHV